METLFRHKFNPFKRMSLECVWSTEISNDMCMDFTHAYPIKIEMHIIQK